MTYWKKTILLALMLGIPILVACTPQIPSYDYSKEPDPRRSEFVVGVGDGLQITVWKNPALSTSAVVRPDGTITMPLIGDIRAAGKTPTQIKKIINKRLAAFIKLEGSETTVAVTAVNSYRFTVSGQVGHPGVYSSKYYVTVAEAIALAGGFTRFAKRDQIVLMRREPKTHKIRRIPIVYSAIASGADPQMNLVLLPGDSIYVP